MSLLKIRAPALPHAPVEHDRQQADAYSKILRIYFNQIDTANAQLVAAVMSLQQSVADGFLYIPTIAGAPVAPPEDYTGHVAFVYDTVGDDLYVYNGSWKKSHFA